LRYTIVSDVSAPRVLGQPIERVLQE